MDIHKQLKNMGIDKTTQAVSKWLNGESIAEADSMMALCSWLKVRREWLEYGVLPKNISTHQAHEKHESNVHSLDERLGKVPLISWAQAGTWSAATLNFDPCCADTWLFCPVSISRHGYALQVRGDSMTNPGSGRSYPAGCIIFVDPEVDAHTGDRVIARVPRTDEVTFKILVEDAGRQFLRPINPQYPIIDITDETHICGKVIGSFIPE